MNIGIIHIKKVCIFTMLLGIIITLFIVYGFTDNKLIFDISRIFAPLVLLLFTPIPFLINSHNSIMNYPIDNKKEKTDKANKGCDCSRVKGGFDIPPADHYDYSNNYDCNTDENPSYPELGFTFSYVYISHIVLSIIRRIDTICKQNLSGLFKQ